MSDLKGKVAVVTGGARDIGKYISMGLAKEGVKVVVNYYNSEDKAKQTIEEIQSFGGEAIAVKADVSKLSDIQKLKDRTTEAFGNKVDILVNNAGGLFCSKDFKRIR